MKLAEPIYGITVTCEFTELKDISSLVAHNKNPNKHSSDQIQRLVQLIRYHGFRHPIVISKLSGLVVSGHGRWEAAKHLGMKKVPVDYQDFRDADAEYAFLVSDNAIALWAELDFLELGPNFEVDMLGIRDFVVDPKFEPDIGENQGDLDKQTPIECPQCGVKFVR
jgi:hypothetical protein